MEEGVGETSNVKREFGFCGVWHIHVSRIPFTSSLITCNGFNPPLPCARLWKKSSSLAPVARD
jgi:hypothetical protein